VVGHLASGHGWFSAVALHVGDASLLSPKRTVGDLDELLTSHDQGGYYVHSHPSAGCQQEGPVLFQRATGKGWSLLRNAACSCKHTPTLGDTLPIFFSSWEVGIGGVRVEYG